MTVDDLVTAFGSQQIASEKVGVWKTNVSYWKRHGIPYRRQCQLYHDFEELKAYPPEKDHAGLLSQAAS